MGAAGLVVGRRAAVIYRVKVDPDQPIPTEPIPTQPIPGGTTISTSPTPPQERRAVQIVAVVVCLAALAFPVARSLTAHHAAPGPGPAQPAGLGPVPSGHGLPNLLEIVVDDENDLTCHALRTALPLSSPTLLDHGTCWQNTTVPDPVCCPARATIQSGQYPHNSGVLRQTDAYRLDDSHTVQYALGRAGVETFGVGKDLNGVDADEYRSVVGAPRVATGAVSPTAFDTGFDRFAFWDRYSSSLSVNMPIFTEHGPAYLDQRSSTSAVTGGVARKFIADMHAHDPGRPWQTYMAFYPPHEQIKHGTFAKFPVPTLTHRYTPVPRLPYRSLLERDRSDKLPLFRQRQPPARLEIGLNAARERSMLDVDQQIAATLQQLRNLGELDDTVVTFVSDNGFLLGQHGWQGKGVPYTESVSVPMITYGPKWFRQGYVDDRQASLVDLAPTIYDIYGITPAYRVDGHSLLSDYRRRGVQFEYDRDTSRKSALESGLASRTIPSWGAFRRGTDEYVEWYHANGQAFHPEFYTDLRQDDNLLDDGHRVSRRVRREVALFRADLHRYARCAGTVEQHSPHPCT